MAGLPSDVEIMRCLNLEVVPQSMDIHNPFSEITLFKKNFSETEMTKSQIRVLKKYFLDVGRPYFFAYPNGKSAARLRPHLLPRTVHAFGSVNRDGDFEEDSNVVSGLTSELTVYHYPNCGFDQYLTKYSVLGKFKDNWFTNVAMPDFHMQSRDAFGAFDFRRLKGLYQQNVQFSDQDAIRTLLKVGLFEQNKYMSNLTKKIVKS